MTRLVYNSSDKHPLYKEDGSKWPFIMVRNGKTVLADTRTELVGTMIPGYDSIPHDEEGDELAFFERFKQSVATANMLQELAAAMICLEQDKSIEDLTEEELTVAFTNRMEHPTDILGIEHWDSDIPLVLVTSMFQPYDERTPPTGNVSWIDPTDETTFLASLAELGQLELFMAG